jgi:threonine aldolase
MERAAVLRHQFGGGVLHAWESAAVAMHYLDGFEERYQKAVRAGDELIRCLEQKNFRVHRIEAGTNVFQLEFPSNPSPDYQKRLADRGIMIGKLPAKGPLDFQVNETILRRSPMEIAQELAKALV